jgi:hypothetical protein
MAEGTRDETAFGFVLTDFEDDLVHGFTVSRAEAEREVRFAWQPAFAVASSRKGYEAALFFGVAASRQSAAISVSFRAWLLDRNAVHCRGAATGSSHSTNATFSPSWRRRSAKQRLRHLTPALAAEVCFRPTTLTWPPATLSHSRGRGTTIEAEREEARTTALSFALWLRKTSY